MSTPQDSPSRRREKTGHNNKRKANPGASKPIAVLDTNVIVDAQSCHDLLGKFTDRQQALGDRETALNDPAVTYRMERARDALLLMSYLHRIRARTFGLHQELVDVLSKNAPPSELANRFETVYTMVFTWFVRSKVLSRWNHVVPKEPGSERGNDADQALVNAAEKLGVPLISNEGYSSTGTINEKKLIRELGKKQGVQVLLPREFHLEKRNETEERAAFLQRFHKRAPAYLAAHVNRFGSDGLAGQLEEIYGIYRLVLKG